MKRDVNRVLLGKMKNEMVMSAGLEGLKIRHVRGREVLVWLSKHY